jgi:hypothetical protein
LTRVLALFCSLTAVVTLVVATPADAIVSPLSCVRSGSVMNVSLNVAGGATLSRKGDVFIVKWSQSTEKIPCVDPIDAEAFPTRFNIDTINFTGTTGDDSLAISLANGKFGPGSTDEGEGKSEIEINVDLKTGENYFAVYGRAAPNVLRFGATFADSAAKNGDLNNDDDYDVFLTGGVSQIDLWGGASDDQLSGGGSNALGPAALTPVGISGGDGDDRLTGSDAGETISGGPGADVLKGLGALDGLYGNGGPDVLKAVDDGADLVDCGNGSDSATVDPGDNVIIACETVTEVTP